ncbi:TPA: hypothetical protein OMS17_003759 [Klebsiella aerogenes]|nr:hypothetical protein [Klebsiella aerogenes]
MTTDITELAQLRKELSNPAIGSKDHLRTLALSLVEALEKAQRYIEELREWNAGLALESCELQQRIVELENQLKAAENNEIDARCRIAELESQIKFPGVMRCNTCGFSRTHIIATPDGMRAGKSEPENCPNGCGPMWHDTYRRQYDELYDAYTALRESNAQVIHARDHYKRMSEEGLKQLAESRTVTVKLPQAVSAGGQGYQEKVERILTAAGIKWEAE